MTSPHAIQPTPRPPTDAERADAAAWRADQRRHHAVVAAVVLLGVALLAGAGIAYARAVEAVRPHGIYVVGSLHAPDYTATLVLAVAGAVVLVVAAITATRRR